MRHQPTQLLGSGGDTPRGETGDGLTATFAGLGLRPARRRGTGAAFGVSSASGSANPSRSADAAHGSTGKLGRA
jgi:hypothetical protein